MTIGTNGTNGTTDLGNTNTKSRRVCFTLFNYEPSEMEQMEQRFRSLRFIVGEEECPTTKKKHLQGYVEATNPRSFLSWKKLIGHQAHIEKARGNTYENYQYCSKDNHFITNIEKKTIIPYNERIREKLLTKYENVVWRDWQQNIIDLCKTKPDDRTIHWFWEPSGNVGKSFLAKYLFITNRVLLGGGKSADILYILSKYIEEEKDCPEVLIIDIPRSSYDYVNYALIENIKNGLVNSPKYESKTLLLDDMHIICFANEPPKMDELSKDRWNIIRLN